MNELGKLYEGTQEALDQPCKCPHCDKEIHISVVESVKERSKVKFTMTAAPGELFRSEQVGRIMVSHSKLMRALGRDLGVETEAYLVGTSMSGEEVSFEVLLVRKAAQPLAQPEASR
jgi:hypothetical protein